MRLFSRVFTAIAISACAVYANPSARLSDSNTQQDVWAQKDIDAICAMQWQGQQRSIENCRAHGLSKIGHSKSQEDIDRLEALKKAPATEDKAVWTQQEISLMCESRWQNQLKARDDCKARNGRKIGHEKSPGEMQELELLVQDALQKKQP